MSINLVLAFLAVAVPAFFTPGPNNLMLMASSAKFGVTRTLPHALGVCLGFPLMVFLVGFGLGEVFTAYPVLKTILKYAAALILLWMAWTLLGFKVGTAQGAERPMRLFEAAVFQWVNPKGWTMAVTLVGLFVEPGEAKIPSLLAVTLGCLLLSPFSTGMWVGFGVQLHAILSRTGLERHLGLILAALMVIAVVLSLL